MPLAWRCGASGLNSLHCCLYTGACCGGFGVGERLRIWENSLESGSGLFIRTAGGDHQEEWCSLRGSDGGPCKGTMAGRSVRSSTRTWLKM